MKSKTKRFLSMIITVAIMLTSLNTNWGIVNQTEVQAAISDDINLNP